MYAFPFNSDRLISRHLLDSIAEIHFLADTLASSQRSDVTILDISAGYGRLAYRLTTAFPTQLRALCVDAVRQSTFLSEFYLRFRAVDGGTRLITLEKDQRRFDYLPELEARDYKLVNQRPRFPAPSVQKHSVSPTYHHLFELQP